MYLTLPSVAKAAVRSKAVVLLLLIYCLSLFCITVCPFYFCNHLEEEEKAGCFAIIVLEMYCYYKYSVGRGLVCSV